MILPIPMLNSAIPSDSHLDLGVYSLFDELENTNKCIIYEIYDFLGCICT